MNLRDFVPIAALTCVILAPTPAFAQAAGEDSAVIDTSCGHDCLIGYLDKYIAALRAGDASRLHVTGNVRFTEDDVELPLGKGLWQTVTGVDEHALEVADPITGNAAWFGGVRENGVPAIYAVRIHVTHGLIDEIESVVNRKTTMMGPFGDATKLHHDPAFNEVLAPAEQRPRERLLAIAHSYFDTVELNDGQVFAPFSDDCERLENGMSTTAAPKNGGFGAGNLSVGCLNQFKLGIYKINKRVRRYYPIVDTERGIVVAAGFFDHANEFDHYKLTDGRDMKTALKWPNSISLLEAFRIKNGEIQRIEAVFTYVPYFMHNPFWGPDSSPPQYAPQPDVCNDACLDADARNVMKAMVGNHWKDVDWADKVGYGEDSVGVRVGEGTWATVTAVDDKPLVIADADTGKAVWIGRIEDHGQPAWAAVTVTAAGKQVGDVEAVFRRKEYKAPYAEPTATPAFGELPKAQRTSREDMLNAVDGFYVAFNAHQGQVPAGLADNCQWTANGQALGACAAPFAANSLQWLAGFRDRQVLAVDEARGLVAVEGFEDQPSVPRSFTGPNGASMPNPTSYPRTLQVVEVFRFRDGKVEQIQRISSELPYGMKPHR